MNYGIIICGHSLGLYTYTYNHTFTCVMIGAGVTVLLTLMFKYKYEHMNNNENNDEEKYNDKNLFSILKLFCNNRKFHGYAIAPPAPIERLFALKIANETSSYLTSFIYENDIIARMSWRGVCQTRSSINRLIKYCHQSQWWIYERSVIVQKNIICDALDDECPYLLSNNSDVVSINIDVDNDEKRDVDDDNGEELFLKDVEYDLAEMHKSAVENELSDNLLWQLRFSHTGYIFHICRSGRDRNLDVQNESMEHSFKECCSAMCSVFCKSLVCNVIRCRFCLHANDTKYIVYRANPDMFVDRMLITSRMMADHMPHLYLHVLQQICDVGK